MAISVFDLFTIGQAARDRVELYGSLALTGKGHGTDRTVVTGLEGASIPGAEVGRQGEVGVAWRPSTRRLRAAGSPST